MPNMSLNKNPMPAQEPKVRAHNFSEVALGYTEETAINEAERCLNCKNMPCVTECPVNIHIPEFISNINSNYGRFNSCFFMPPIIRGHFFCWSAACQSAYKRRGSFSEGCGDLGEHRP